MFILSLYCEFRELQWVDGWMAQQILKLWRCGGHSPGPGFVEQVGPSLCQTLELDLNLLPVQSVCSGCDPFTLGTDHIHSRPAVI